MLTKYQEFILEKYENELLELLNESVFILSDDLTKIMNMLSQSNDYAIERISNMFIDMDVVDLDTNISYLDITDNNGLLSFLNPEKAEKFRKENDLTIKELLNKLKGNKVRLGRLVRKIADIYIKYNGWKEDGGMYTRYKFTDEEIEKFVNEFKSTYDFYKKGTGDFEIVSGNKILFAYDESNYYEVKGTLSGSCMRYDDCQEYLQFYVDNGVELLVLWGPNNKVMARALIWKLTNDKKFMDRVYYNRDSDLNLFIKYAQENNFLYKEENNSSPGKIMLPDDDYSTPQTLQLEVNVYTIRYSDRVDSRFPYADTLKYYYWREGKLKNWRDSSNYYVTLEDTEGWCSCSWCGGDGYSDCDDCNGSGEQNCSSCDGSGCDECNTKLGGGTVGCDTCDSDGSVTCDKCGGFSNQWG